MTFSVAASAAYSLATYRLFRLFSFTTVVVLPNVATNVVKNTLVKTITIRSEYAATAVVVHCVVFILN